MPAALVLPRPVLFDDFNTEAGSSVIDGMGSMSGR